MPPINDASFQKSQTPMFPFPERNYNKNHEQKSKSTCTQMTMQTWRRRITRSRTIRNESSFETIKSTKRLKTSERTVERVPIKGLSNMNKTQSPNTTKHKTALSETESNTILISSKLIAAQRQRTSRRRPVSRSIVNVSKYTQISARTCHPAKSLLFLLLFGLFLDDNHCSVSQLFSIPFCLSLSLPTVNAHPNGEHLFEQLSQITPSHQYHHSHRQHHHHLNDHRNLHLGVKPSVSDHLKRLFRAHPNGTTYPSSSSTIVDTSSSVQTSDFRPFSSHHFAVAALTRPAENSSPNTQHSNQIAQPDKEHFSAELNDTSSIQVQTFHPARPESLAQTKCSPICSCKWRSGKKWVECPPESILDQLPTGLDPATQVLVLTGNPLSTLSERVFELANLRNLQRLHLSSCQISAVANGAFQSLSNLVELDLSTNELSSVPTGSLCDTPLLRKLNIAKNRLQSIPDGAFDGLQNLQSLDLSENAISNIHLGAFSSNRHLKHLLLHNNQLSSLDGSAISTLGSVLELTLQHNPWKCDCGLRTLREWIEQRDISITITPNCSSPDRLRSKFWSELDLDSEFACPPRLIDSHHEITLHEGENASLECTMEAIPSVTLEWRWKGEPIRNMSWMTFGRQMYIIRESNLPAGGFDSSAPQSTYSLGPISTFSSSQSSISLLSPLSSSSSSAFPSAQSSSSLSSSSLLEPETTMSPTSMDYHRNSGAIESNRNYRRTSTLHIVNALEKDSGSYVCYGSNAAGSVTSNYTLTVLKKPEVISVAADFYSSQRVTALSCGSLLLILGAIVFLFAFIVRARKLRHLDHRSSGSSCGTASGTTVITNNGNNNSATAENNVSSNHQYWNHNGNGTISNGNAHFQSTITANGTCLSDNNSAKHGSVADFIFSFVPSSGSGKLKSDSITFVEQQTGRTAIGGDSSPRQVSPTPAVTGAEHCLQNGTIPLGIQPNAHITINRNSEYVYISPHYVNIDNNYGPTPSMVETRPVTPTGHSSELDRAGTLPIVTSSTMDQLVTSFRPRPLLEQSLLTPIQQQQQHHRPLSVQFRLPAEQLSKQSSLVPNGTVFLENSLPQIQQLVQHQQQQHHQQQQLQQQQHHLPAQNHQSKPFQQSFQKHTFQQHHQQQQQQLLNRGKSSEFELYETTVAASDRSSTSSSLRSGSICVNPMAIMMPSVSKCSANLTASGTVSVPVSIGTKASSHTLSNALDSRTENHSASFRNHRQQHQQRISPDEGLGDDDTSQPW